MVVKVRGHYDQDKATTIRVRNDDTISLRTYRAACKRAGLIQGDYLVVDKGLYFIYDAKDHLWGVLG